MQVSGTRVTVARRMANESFRVVSGNAAGTQINLGDEFQIGRAAPTEGRLGDDPELSRAHARVTRNPQGQLVIEDLGSTNGTAVNGQRISGPTVLKPGDTVQVGKSTLQFQGEGADLQRTALGAAPAGAPPAAPAAAATPPPPPPPPPGPPTGPTQPLGAGPQSPPPGGAGRPPGAPPPPTAAGGNGGGGRKGIFIGIGALALVAAVVVAVLLLAGGGDDDGGEDTAAAEEEITQVLETFAEADDCDELTDDAVEKLVGEDAENPREACDEGTGPADDFEVTSVEVDGDQADAEMEIDGEDADLELVNEDDEWLIDDLSGPAFVADTGGDETTPGETEPTPAPEEPAEDPAAQQRRLEARATVDALIEAIKTNDEQVFCGLLSPRLSQKLVGGPGGSAAIARCVEVVADVDLSEDIGNIEVTGIRVSGSKASVRTTAGDRITLVRRGGRWVVNSGLGE